MQPEGKKKKIGEVLDPEGQGGQHVAQGQ